MEERKAELHHIPELDGVRGIAILAVLLLHFHAPFQATRPLGLLSDIIARGYTGVDMFFVLSGFLITSILISTRGASNYFRAFYARRSLRIFPLAFFMIALLYWICLLYTSCSASSASTSGACTARCARPPSPSSKRP